LHWALLCWSHLRLLRCFIQNLTVELVQRGYWSAAKLSGWQLCRYHHAHTCHKQKHTHVTADCSSTVFFLSRLNPLRLIMTIRLIFQERKFILNCYWKCENAVALQNEFRWRKEVRWYLQFSATPLVGILQCSIKRIAYLTKGKSRWWVGFKIPPNLPLHLNGFLALWVAF